PSRLLHSHLSRSSCQGSYPPESNSPTSLNSRMPDLSREMAGSLELEPTAALVMAWAKDLYREGSASLFYSRLDLSAGRQMKRECDSVCPWYPEVMMNRKWFIRHLALGAVSGACGHCQVVILAAGKSPLALELLD